MPLKTSKFKLDEQIVLAGNAMNVAGMLQLEHPDGRVMTRYALAAEDGATQLLEECNGAYTLLRPFPPAARPEVTGSTVTVMGEKYELEGTQRLAVLGTAGSYPGALKDAAVLLSGRFVSAMGGLLREIAPGAAAAEQNFYALKEAPAETVMTAEAHAAVLQEQMQQRAAAAQAAAETGGQGSGKWVKVLVAIVIVAFLVYACSGSDEQDGSGSARTVSGGFHGK
jgi:hypothetical protein